MNSPVRSNLTIVYQDIAALKPRKDNPRTHSKKQIAQIARAIEQFGFTNPVLVDDCNGIIAGHGRVEAAKIVNLKQVPTVRLSAMSEAEIRAYVIADNKLAENAGWDQNLLGLKLQYLSELDLNFDVTLTGFELPEIDLLIGELTPANNNDSADAVIPVAPGAAITRAGDVWKIGSHRLICGDSTKRETYQHLLGDVRAQLVFTDPPYNVPISGHVGVRRLNDRSRIAVAKAPMSSTFSASDRPASRIARRQVRPSSPGRLSKDADPARPVTEVHRPHCGKQKRSDHSYRPFESG